MCGMGPCSDIFRAAPGFAAKSGEDGAGICPHWFSATWAGAEELARPGAATTSTPASSLVLLTRFDPEVAETVCISSREFAPRIAGGRIKGFAP